MGDIRQRVAHTRFDWLTVWVALALAFPLMAIFEQSAAWAPIVAIGAMGALSITGFALLPTSSRWAIALAAGLALAFAGAASSLAYPSSVGPKLGLFLQVVALFGVVMAVAVSDGLALKRLWLGLLLVGFIATGLLLANPGQYQVGRISFGDTNPIWMARAIGLLGLGAFGLLISGTRHPVLCVGAIVLAIGGVLLTGSRGPLVALVIAMAVGAASFDYPRKSVALVLTLWGAALLALVAEMTGLFGSLRGLTFGSGDATSAVRLNAWQFALDLIAANPEGIGVGRFRYGAIVYPHNIFLEFLVEWGVALGGVFCAGIALGAWGLFRLGPQVRPLKLLLVYELVNASLSGDITSPRFLYGLVIVGLSGLLFQALGRTVALNRQIAEA